MAEFPGIPYAGPARARYGSYAKRYMVIHCTANTAPPVNEASFARTRTDGVGMHFVSDPTTVLQVLESWYGTGHVGSTTGNRYGMSWEFVGHITWPASYWRACIDRAAPAMRLPMDKHGIPARWLTDAQLADGHSRGLVTHLQCSRVLGGSNHVDPGPHFPQQYLIDALNGDDMLTPDQEQMLKNVSDWVYDQARGLTTADPGTPHIAEYVPNRWLKELVDRPPAELTAEQVDQLADRLATNTTFIDAIVAGVRAGLPTAEQRVDEARQGAELAEDS
jgi:hypothetical protein